MITSPHQALIDTAIAMEQAGFAVAKSGNVSVRTGTGMLITPSGVPYRSLQPPDLVQMDLEGRVLQGRLAPSSEWQFHAAIYHARDDAAAIVHTHSPAATALSSAHQSIPAFHYTVAMAGGNNIRCAPYATFGTAALATEAVAGLCQRRAVLLANHGVIAIGASLAAAFALACEVESLADRYLRLLAAGLTPQLLDDEEMARVAAQFERYKRYDDLPDS
ncbi:MAG: class II aldolase/adducin family protein [Steroidobacteraceae bacterium]